MDSTSATTSSDALARRFELLRRAGRRALVTYVTAGHPDPETSVALLRALERAGADVVELGIPFSDPMADGRVIQASSQRALAHGMTFDRTLHIMRDAALTVPVVIFSYLNPVLAAGENALTRAANAGASGILLTDLPVGADPPLERRFGLGPVAFVRLVAPTTPDARMREIAEHGSGFVYLISRLGVTGARDDVAPELPATVARLRAVTTLPVCVGFGLSTPEQVRAVGRIADGVVVGSAVVAAAERSVGEAEQLVASMRAALDAA